MTSPYVDWLSRLCVRVVDGSGFVIDPRRVQEAKRALCRKLAAGRTTRGLIQDDIAQRVYSTRSTVADVESGRQLVDRIFWQRCEAILDAGGELITGYEDYRSLTGGGLPAARLAPMRYSE